MDSPISLIVRFATSIPDISLIIASPDSTAVANIKRQIRAHLPEEERKHGLRLIYSGRVLDGQSSLSAALNLSPSSASSQPSFPPLFSSKHDASSSRSSLLTPDNGGAKGKGKGKALPLDTPPVYIHCAISSFPISQADLAAELRPPVSPAENANLPKPFPGTITSGASTPSTRPQGRGFDRLLSSQGFTRSDVAELRAQHTALISNRYTPDTMPSQEALLDMEEAWLGEGTSSAASGSGAGVTTAGRAADEDEQSRMLADTLYGAMMGFFWPVGALAWGFKEEGVWSKRRKEMVLLGLLLNGVFGIMSMLSL